MEVEEKLQEREGEKGTRKRRTVKWEKKRKEEENIRKYDDHFMSPQHL